MCYISAICIQNSAKIQSLMHLRRIWCKKRTSSLQRVTNDFLPMGLYQTCLLASTLILVDIAIKSVRHNNLIKLVVISTSEANARRNGSYSWHHVARSHISENITMLEIWNLLGGLFPKKTGRFTSDRKYETWHDVVFWPPLSFWKLRGMLRSLGCCKMKHFWWNFVANCYISKIIGGIWIKFYM